MRSIAICSLLALSACGLLGTRGSLHDAPSSAADLPFQAPGVYLRDPGPPEFSAYRAIVFEADGTLYGVRDTVDIDRSVREGGYAALKGTYKATGTTVEMRFFTPHPVGNYSSYVQTFVAEPASDRAFRVLFGADRPGSSYHSYTLQRD